MRLYYGSLWLCAQDLATNYKHAIEHMLKIGSRRLIVNLDDLRDYDRSVSDG